ncbi:MAG: M81 family metallopeptidase [Gemmatimonadetes bacterium]|jgi:microcystin degradation protein MlrC|nr:M81 family metallopeptidase [Gemmatimonadota bacterium]MBT7859624.1 M81 family metallopeptidase [Gemmatimonadota bacterium]
MRVATGAISHETSTFTPIPTTRQDYEERYGFLRGAQIIETFTGTNTPIGGFIEGAQAHGFELVPTIYAEPHPAGRTARALFDEILGELLDGLKAAAPLDGVLLELHGSMAVEGIDDADGHILRAVRDTVGDTPVLVQLDIHSNVSDEMADAADVLIGRETFPEIDMAERGRECASVLMQMLTTDLHPTMALHRIPMIWGMNQVTAHEPMAQAIAELYRIEAQPGVVCASIATCFPLADVPWLGASVYVVTDDDQNQAQQLADELGEWIYERRAEWHFERYDTASTLDRLGDDPPRPLVLADRDDNTGGGAPGDSTGVLRTFLERGLHNACVLYIVDVESVQACLAASVGARVDLQVGGKSSPMQGDPVRMQARVVAVSPDGRFHYDGPMYEGLEGCMGPSAHIEQDGVHVILVSQREQPFCTAFARSLELDPRQMSTIAVKSAAHFRAGFESWAGAVHLVSEPCVHSEWNLQFTNTGRQLYPLDAEGRYPRKATE